eukprot:19604-Heterococcus_DN1.PRE.3
MLKLTFLAGCRLVIRDESTSISHSVSYCGYTCNICLAQHCTLATARTVACHTQYVNDASWS